MADVAGGLARVGSSGTDEVGARPTLSRAPRRRATRDELWRRYRIAADDMAREQLILHYAPLVKYVASRIAAGTPATIEFADLVSFGVLGLIDAIERFDPRSPATFETYAVNRIRGAILDELRAIDWVPRRVRARTRAVEQALRDLEGALHRAPTDDELADALGWSLTKLHEALSDAAMTTIGVLDTVGSDVPNDRPSLAETLGDITHAAPHEQVERDELRRVLRQGLRALTEPEQMVVTLYYFEGLTLGAICDVIGVSESRVCQIHAKAVMSLRNVIDAATGAGPRSLGE